VIELRKRAQRVVSLIGGKAIHPVTGVPGGVAKRLTAEERDEIVGHTAYFLEFAKFTIGVFDQVVLGNQAYVDMILSDTYTHRLYSMGTVDENNKGNFYDGKIRVVDPDGKEFVKFPPRDYLQVLAEHVEPWTYLKFPFLKQVGWKGFVEGKDSGVYRATPLSRLNAADGMATPLAQEQYERMYQTLGGKPVHQTLATHWARVIELLYAAERAAELARDDEILSDKIRTIPTATPSEGVGCVEAPRGTLYHHYVTDERGILRKVNLIVGTTNNHAPIAMSIRKAAHGVIRRGVEITDGVLNRIEMAFRAYDPCFGCATHSLPGKMPLEVQVFDSHGNLLTSRRRESV
jgi:F420-non-reducing hydrogenase large subunit